MGGSRRKDYIAELEDTICCALFITGDILDPVVLCLLVELDSVQRRRYLWRESKVRDRGTVHYKIKIPQQLDLPLPDFRKHFRVTHAEFNSIHALIADDPVFVAPAGRPQAPVAFQLLVALHRFTHNGPGESAFEIHHFFGLSGE